MDDIESGYLAEQLAKHRTGVYDDEDEYSADVERYVSGATVDERGTAKAMRDAIATDMWNSYIAHTRSSHQ